MDSSIQSATDMAAMQVTAPAHLSRLGSGGNIDKTAKDFEGMFMSQMLQPMFEGIDVDPVFGGGNGEKVMRSFLIQEYGKLASQNSHFGIADAVKNEMIRAQTGSKSSAHAVNAYNGGQNVATTAAAR